MVEAETMLVEVSKADVHICILFSSNTLRFSALPLPYLTQVAKLGEEERLKHLDALAEELQAKKNQELAAAAEELSKRVGDGAELKEMRVRAEEELKVALLQLRDRFEREQDGGRRALQAELQANHDRALRQAEDALTAANTRALRELRERLTCVMSSSCHLLLSLSLSLS